MKYATAILFIVPFCWAAAVDPPAIVEDEVPVYENRTVLQVERLIDQPPVFPIRRNSREQWSYVVSKINHFDPNSAKFKLRFVYNLEFARVGSPIIVYVGGEWTVSEGSLSSGQIYEIARENNGAMFYLEHRYYGDSVPTSDLSTSNLAYHSSRQAMEDIRLFYEWLRESPSYSQSKLILVGCSYSASLSMFTKQMYPDMVTGVYATSGPLLATFDMYQYLEVVTSVVSNADPQCANIISSAVQTMQTMYNNGQKKQLHDMFSVCSSPAQEPLDNAAFFQRFAYYFANLVQSTSYKLKPECLRLRNSAGATNLDKFAKYFAVKEGTCAPGTFYHQPGGFLNTDKKQEGRSWLWQECNEFGWFVTTNGNNQMFGSSIRPTLYYALCRAVFGNAGQSDAQLEAKIAAINRRNNVVPGKGAGLKNIVFMYGTADPWGPMGYNQLPNSQTTMIRIEGAGHCEDMRSSSTSDSASMRSAKNKMRSLIKQWLNE